VFRMVCKDIMKTDERQGLAAASTKVCFIQCGIASNAHMSAYRSTAPFGLRQPLMFFVGELWMAFQNARCGFRQRNLRSQHC
jgi:hypothetical protein